MTVNTENKITEKENVVDDLSGQVEMDKLAALKAKMAAQKGTDMPPKIVEKKTRSIRFGVVGTGQAGSRLCEYWNKLGYDAIALNTATQDLAHIKLDDSCKFLLNYGLGGAGKSLSLGEEAAEAHKDAINELIHEKLGDSQALILCSSLGGGSGAGSLSVLIDLLSNTGKPIIVIAVLPMNSDDPQTKQNALESLSKLAKEAQNKRIHNLICVDNAKIENIYSDVNHLDFFEVSNKAIVEPLDTFNTMSSKPSPIKGLDPTEFAKLAIDGNGLSVYGQFSVTNYTEDTALAEAVISNLTNGLLASGFILSQAKYVGVLFVANKEVWAKIPSSSVNYAMSMVQDLAGASAVFKGIYVEDMAADEIKVYSFFSGMGLPNDRVSQLKKEAQEGAIKAKEKEAERNLNLKLDTGTDETVSAADKIKQKIANKKSALGNLINNSVQDRRKK